MIKHQFGKFARANYGVDRWSALLTWAFVSGACLYFLASRNSSPVLSLHWLSAATAMLIFMIAFHCATRSTHYRYEPTTRLWLILVQLIAIVVVYWLVPYNFAAILMVMAAAQLPYFMPLHRAIACSPLLVIPHFLIYQFYWQDDFAWLSAVLFWTFTVFSIVMMGTQLKEARGREREQAINRELRATQALLAEASKQDERSRIARNIHDLLGHHLTALTINLQVAERQTTGEAQQVIQKSRSIAQLLLADVREAVSALRESDNLDIAAALAALHTDIPNKVVNIKCQPELRIRQVEVAEVVIFIVKEALTNFMKHSSGDCFTAYINNAPGEVIVRADDNGISASAITFGNGLKGMHERVTAVSGDLTINTDNGVTLLARIPLEFNA